MPNINFPSGPTAGTTYTFNGGQWTYNGVAWVLNGTVTQGTSISLTSSYIAFGNDTNNNVIGSPNFTYVYNSGTFNANINSFSLIDITGATAYFSVSPSADNILLQTSYGNQGNRIELDTNNVTISGGGIKLLQTDPAGRLVKIGDVDSVNNGTNIFIDDVNSTTEITNKLVSTKLSYRQNIGSAGEVVYFGSGTTTIGTLHYFDGTIWSPTDATIDTKSKYLLGVALGSDPGVNGMLVRGYAAISSVGGYSNGDILYISDSVGGDVTNVAPSTAGHVVRIVGYVVNTSINQLYFCPDTTWINLF
jgi:hypothetical protein